MSEGRPRDQAWGQQVGGGGREAVDQPSAPCAQIELLCGTSEPLDCRNEVQWILSGSRNITEAFLPHLPVPYITFLATLFS